MSTATTRAPQSGEPEKSKTFWERIIATTPVVLTVVATILAGLSSSELTRAQYYRSLAAQQQAKVSDQWNFFQAKRIRGADMEGTITLLRSGTGAGGVSADSLRAAARRLADDFKRAGQEAEALLKAVEAAKDGLGPEAAERLRQAGQRLRDTAANAAGVAGQFDESLSGTDAGRALAFLSTETARAVADDYPFLEFEEMHVDSLCLQLALDPTRYDVLVMENLFGDVISDLCAGLVGGLGLVPGANFGNRYALFEAVHGTAPDIAGKGLANPIALVRSAALMLDHIGQHRPAGRIEQSVRRTLANQRGLTRDLGGDGNTATITKQLVANL